MSWTVMLWLLVMPVPPTEGPSSVSELFDDNFVTRRLTADDTVSLNDWGVVTGDGSNIDPYDLASRLLSEGRKHHLKLSASDSQFGPVIHDLSDGQVYIVRHGTRGLWKTWSGGAKAPAPATDTEWANVIRLRHYELAVRTRLEPGALAAADLMLDTPISARIRLIVGQVPRREVLAVWVKRWGHDRSLTEAVLSYLRSEGHGALFEELFVKLPVCNATLWVEGARQAEADGRRDQALSRLRRALHDEPFHRDALRLMRIWS